MVLYLVCLLSAAERSWAIDTAGFTGSLLEPVSITSGPTLSVSQFGAVGDGKKDDTAAIQSALNYIKGHGGTLNFEAGRTYIVSKSLKIVGADDFKIDGNDATIKMADGVPVKSGYSILFVERSNHFAVTDLTVDGNRANRSPAEVPAHNVHIKGSQGSLQSIDARPSLTLSFNRFVSKQKCHGLRKLHLNNSAEDRTFMTDVLCSELFRQSGVPAARGAYATLVLNRRKLGLYVLKEGLTKEFLGQYFRRTDGNLYDGGFQRDVNRPMERIHGDGPGDQADRLALVAAAREPAADRRWQRLQQVLDLDRFITSLALQTITWNWAGYAMARNNYRIYHDPESDKLVFIPHGMDQMFWEPQGTIYPRMHGLVASAVMRVPEGRSLYRARLASINASQFKVAALTARVNELAALIEPYFPQAPEAAAKLRGLIVARSRSIAEQLQLPEPQTATLIQGVAR
jgi:hypothetical protein